MRLISLNTWGGRVPSIIPFFKVRQQNVDIFCLQEVYYQASEASKEVSEERGNFFMELEQILPDFVGYFTQQIEGYGVATFVRKSIEVESVNSTIILSVEELNHLKMPDGESYYPRVLQSLRLVVPRLTVHNFHGVPGGNKVDSPERELQTRCLLEVLMSDSNPKILTGDFNLNPDTAAISALEETLQNPLKESGFSSTRSSFYKKRDIMPYADYAFVSPELDIKDFQILPDEVSDHLALYLNCIPKKA